MDFCDSLWSSSYLHTLHNWFFLCTVLGGFSVKFRIWVVVHIGLMGFSKTVCDIHVHSISM